MCDNVASNAALHSIMKKKKKCMTVTHSGRVTVSPGVSVAHLACEEINQILITIDDPHHATTFAS